MEQLVLHDGTNPSTVALMVKPSMLQSHYLNSNFTLHINQNCIAVPLLYNPENKAPAKLMKEYIADVLPKLKDLGISCLYVVDGPYFKQLTKVSKIDPAIGYVHPCVIEGFTDFKVVYGVNPQSVIYNPNNQGNLTMSLNAVNMAFEDIKHIGEDIIHSEAYPDTVESIAAALNELHQYPLLSADIEGFSLKHYEAGIGSISFSHTQHDGIAFLCDYRPYYCGKFNDLYGYYQKNPEVRKLIRQFLSTYKGTLIWHGSTYDLKVLIFVLFMDEDHFNYEGMIEGIEVLTKNFHDTKLIAYLSLNSTARNSYGLKSLAHPFCGDYAQDDEDIKDIRRINPPDLLKYNLYDTLGTMYVFNTYYPKMVNDNQQEIYEEIFRASVFNILQIELCGMPMDYGRVLEVEHELDQLKQQALNKLLNHPTIPVIEASLRQKAAEKANLKLKKLRKTADDFKHLNFNPNSNQQLQELLYEILGFPVIDKTKAKAPATGAKTLVKLVNHTNDPVLISFIESLIEYSKVVKILTSFIPAFKAAVDKKDGRVYLHGNFVLGGTVSGRLSSNSPNLQNLPSGSTYGKLIKSCFKPPEGWLFGGADFNSLEDYISALTTKDPNKLKVYLDGYDGHSLRAYSYWPEKFTHIPNTVQGINSIKKLHDDIRSDSKAPTFALTYQGTFITLMNNCGFTKPEAQRIEKAFQELYQVSIQWVQAQLDEARETGYVECAFGLKVRTPLLQQSMKGYRLSYEAEAEGRTAGNALGQSWGLLNNRAANAFMRRVWASPFKYDVMPVALIHDAIYLMFRNDPAVVKFVNDTLIEEMEWQEHPAIAHDQVKIGAALDIFYPDWSKALTLPNRASQEEIEQAVADYLVELSKPK